MRLPRKFTTLAAFLLALLSLPLPPSFAQSTTIQIAGDEEKRDGYLADITSAAFNKVGYLTAFDFVPWSRALQGAILGHYDVLLAAYYTEERAKKLTYSDPIGSVEVYFWKKKERDIPYAKLEDMKPYLIGFIRASSVSPEFDQAMNTYLKMDYVSTPALNIQHLLTGRIDLFVEKKQQVDFLLKTKFLADADQIVTLGKPLKQGKFFNAFSNVKPNHDKLVADFNRGLKMIKEDGTEKAILTKHGMR